MEALIWMIAGVIILILIPIAKEIISDIDYKRQLSGKIPPRTTASSEDKRSVPENTANPELDSIAASERSERFANNTQL